MTNGIYPHAIVRDEDDSSSFNSEVSAEIQAPPPLKTNFFSSIGKVYTAFTRSVNDLASSSAGVMKKVVDGDDDDDKWKGGKKPSRLDSNDQWEKRWKFNMLKNNQVPKNLSKSVYAELIAAGWPSWFVFVAASAITGWIPKQADNFEIIEKIGRGKYSNVYKAKDSLTGNFVALKIILFDYSEPEILRFMAREIAILRRLDHPNVVKLEGLVISTEMERNVMCLVFEYMEHDLASLSAFSANNQIKFSEPQVKYYMQQLLLGLEHCHSRGVLHRDIKTSDILIDNGVVKIAGFGLASFFDFQQTQMMTNRVVTLWYRPPELLLGATDYGVSIDLWPVGCILAELLAGKPIMPGRTEVEQLLKIFKLCGSPTDDYWKKSKLPHATLFKPQQSYKRCIAETFKDFPPSSLPLIEILLDIDPAERLTATAALNSEFFTTKPYACVPSSLPRYPLRKEMNAILGNEEARRLRATGGAAVQAIHAPEANVELQTNLDVYTPTQVRLNYFLPNQALPVKVCTNKTFASRFCCNRC